MPSLFSHSDAGLAAGIFHRGEVTVGQVKAACLFNTTPQGDPDTIAVRNTLTVEEAMGLDKSTTESTMKSTVTPKSPVKTTVTTKSPVRSPARKRSQSPGKDRDVVSGQRFGEKRRKTQEMRVSSIL